MHTVSTADNMPGVRLYHRTDCAAAEAIITGGFADRGDFLTRSLRAEGGVWLSDNPLPWQAPGLEATLSVDIPAEVVAEFEQPVKRKGLREFLVPAEIVNRYGPLTEAEDAIS